MSAFLSQFKHNFDHLEELGILDGNCQRARVLLKYFGVDTQKGESKHSSTLRTIKQANQSSPRFGIKLNPQKFSYI